MRVGRRTARSLLVVLAVAVPMAGCPIVEPPAASPYHAGALAPGNRILLTRDPIGSGTILANPGGVTEFPTDPDAARALFFDAISVGNPVNGDYLATIPGTSSNLGLYDAAGSLRLDAGSGLLTWQFSADGSTLVISRHQPTGSIDVYDTATATLVRHIEWAPQGVGYPAIDDVSADGSRFLAHTADLGWGLPGARPVVTASTRGVDPLVPVLPESTQTRGGIRFTSTGRVAHLVNTGATTELRTVAIDGGSPRTVGEFDVVEYRVAAERSGGRILMQTYEPGSSSLSAVLAVDDAPAGVVSVIAGPIPVTERLSRVVLAAP